MIGSQTGDAYFLNHLWHVSRHTCNSMAATNSSNNYISELCCSQPDNQSIKAIPAYALVDSVSLS